jgi:perosamine synthetase
VFLTPTPVDNPRLRPWITPEDKAAVMAVLDNGDLMSGRQVAAFEEELAAYFGKRHAVCVASGTAALECAFVASKEGTLIDPEAWVAMLHAAHAAQRGGTFTPDGVHTDLLGECKRTDQWRTHDCSHRFGPDAARGDLSCFSFNANKFVSCIGGAVVTNDSAAAAVMRQYRNHGRDGGPEVFRDGRNLRMPEMNAALGRSQLRRIAEILGKRKQVVEWYKANLGAPAIGDGMFLFAHKRKGHNMRSLADFRLDRHKEEWRDVALLPIWPLMTKDDVEAVCRS